MPSRSSPYWLYGNSCTWAHVCMVTHWWYQRTNIFILRTLFKNLNYNYILPFINNLTTMYNKVLQLSAKFWLKSFEPPFKIHIGKSFLKKLRLELLLRNTFSIEIGQTYSALFFTKNNKGEQNETCFKILIFFNIELLKFKSIMHTYMQSCIHICWGLYFSKTWCTTWCTRKGLKLYYFQ